MLYHSFIVHTFSWLQGGVGNAGILPGISAVDPSASSGSVELRLNPQIEDMRRDLCLETPSAKITKPPKINVYLEDEEAKLFFKKMCVQYLKRIDCKILSGGWGALKEAAKLGILGLSETQSAMFIIDGDQIIDDNAPQNLLCLPGGSSPERVFGRFLDSLPPDDPFWKGDYHKKDFLSRYPKDQEDRTRWKCWFNNEKGLWGRRAISSLYQRWRRDNQCLADEFLKKFIKQCNVIAGKRGLSPF
jgi:hypothetical protein